MSEALRLDRVDSEIALTALLAAGVTGYPSPSMRLYPYVKLAAVGLLVLTLAKRVGIINGLTGDDRRIKVATHLMDPATNIAFLYLSFVATSWGVAQLVSEPTSETVALTFGLTVPVVTFAVFLASELLFGGPLREGERILSASADQHRGEVFGGVLRQFSGLVASTRSPESAQQTELTDLRFYDIGVEDMTWEHQKGVARSFGIMLASFALVLLVYAVSVVGATRLFDLSLSLAVLLFVGVLIVSAVFRIWYSNYGLVQVEDRYGPFTTAGEIVTYAVACLLVI